MFDDGTCPVSLNGNDKEMNENILHPRDDSYFRLRGVSNEIDTIHHRYNNTKAPLGRIKENRENTQLQISGFLVRQ